MAYRRSTALALLSDLAFHFALVILYCFLFPQSEERQEWLKEIRQFCNRIHLFTILKKGRLEEKDLMRVLYERPLGERSLYEMMDLVFDEKEQLESPVPRQDFLKQAELLRQQLIPLYRDLIREYLQPVMQYQAGQCLQIIQAHWDYFVKRP
jgi:hypothetical protein